MVGLPVPQRAGEAVGALCRAERVDLVWFFVFLTKCKCIVGPLALFPVRCVSYTVGSYSWDLVHVH